MSVISPQANYAEPDRAIDSQLTGHLMYLEQNVAQLRGRLNELVNRIDPVLRRDVDVPQDVDRAAVLPDPIDTRAPILVAIDKANADLQHAIDFLGTTLERLVV